MWHSLAYRSQQSESIEDPLLGQLAAAWLVCRKKEQQRLTYQVCWRLEN